MELQRKERLQWIESLRRLELQRMDLAADGASAEGEIAVDRKLAAIGALADGPSGGRTFRRRMENLQQM